MESPLAEIQKSLSEIQSQMTVRLASIEADVAALARAAGKRKLEPSFVSLDEAAILCGRSKNALKQMLKRERAKPSGFSIRVIHGGIHRQDFQKYLNYLASKKPGRGAIVRAALR